MAKTSAWSVTRFGKCWQYNELGPRGCRKPRWHLALVASVKVWTKVWRFQAGFSYGKASVFSQSQYSIDSRWIWLLWTNWTVRLFIVQMLDSPITESESIRQCRTLCNSTDEDCQQENNESLLRRIRTCMDIPPVDVHILSRIPWTISSENPQPYL